MAKPPSSIQTLEGIMWLGAAASVLGLALGLHRVFSSPGIDSRHVGVGYQAVSGAGQGQSVPTGPPGTPHLLPSSFDRTLVISDPDLSQRFLLALPDLLLTVALGAIAVLLLLMLRSFREGEPFAPPNAWRLAAVGIALLGIACIPHVEAISLKALVSGSPLEDMGVHSGEDFDWALVTGFAVLALAEFFRQGSRLRADTEGLV
ncbi:hypothetical protein ACFOWE_21280 [Planomonospora corallina]|uniref:DUF2975 domain-containing protein n=1 Tax=Planomonospora corallina TaxID=1806052 RepID=A0ABV8I9H0_9ACTN